MARTLALALTTLLCSVLVALPAQAEDPLRLQNPITDLTSGQVVGSGSAEARQAIQRLTEQRYRLFFVFVDRFTGAPLDDWGHETADLSGMADRDLLVAVAVQDETYTMSISDNSGLSTAALNRVESAIRTELGARDWNGAIVAAAEGYLAAAHGGTDTGGGQSGSMSGVLLLVAVGVVVLVVMLLWRSSKRRAASQAAQRGGPGASGPPAPAPPPEPYAGVPTDELAIRVGSALVGLDDDVRSSESELGFAQAQFGIEETRQYQGVLDQAKKNLSEGFALQRQIQDQKPGEPQRRELLVRILTLCEDAERMLDDKAQAFATMRQLAENVPKVLNELYQRAGEIESRIPTAQATLDQLAVTYPAQALATVSRAPGQADQLIDAARHSVTEGRARLDAGDSGTALAFTRTAEDALKQAADLLESVRAAGTDLASAKENLDAAIASITSDISDAERLAGSEDGVKRLVADAQRAIEAGQAARSGGDPIAALQQLNSAESALDAALAPHREEADNRHRATASLSREVNAADAKIRAANAFINSHRGAVGHQPRTVLAEAIRKLGEARGLAESDPPRALSLAQESLRDANSAEMLARQEVDRWNHGQGGPGGTWTGGNRSSGLDVGSLILGGILGSRSRSQSTWGGGFGGSTWNSPRGSSSRSSFGGGFGGGRSGGSGSFGGGRSGGGGRF